MKKGIRLISLCCSIFIATGIFAGCGSNNPNTATPSAKEPSNKKVVLRMSWWGSEARHKATLDAIQLYMDKNQNIKIEGEYAAFDAYYQKLMTQFAGGTAPDIIQVSSTWLSELTNYKGSSILVDYKKDEAVKDIDLKVFDSAILNNVCTVNDKLVGLPSAINADPSLIINSDFFGKYNIPVDTVWNWDNLLSKGKEVHAKDKNAYLLHSDISSIRQLFATYISQKTGKQFIGNDYKLGFDKNNVVDAFKYLQTLYAEGVVQPYSESLAFDNKPQESPKWVNGETGMIGTPLGTFSAFESEKFKCVGSLYPVGKDAKDSFLGLTSTMLIAINNKSENKKESSDFINWFFNDKDAISTLGEVRGPQPTENGRKILLEANKTDTIVNDAINRVSNQKGTTQNLLYVAATFQKVVDYSIQKVLFNKATPEAAADELIQQLLQKCEESKK
ncbi:ABC transporter substrate-binding protein [Ruminiclostridium papyrosolvens DSM 2782]|uniref:ABC transporter substrate-binding protein n=1 Tax=Ruminiclostridium papyrosolvens TaxID=29362 RepID=UPI0023E36F1A|nr:ABC transporter substrate-binding protein [Ruminiclostridium papyrosolvens]WES33739.1 ABC transporter substrate-binding protein [Ruminiclostridium papyrosolvens DSM 2782]